MTTFRARFSTDYQLLFHRTLFSAKSRFAVGTNAEKVESRALGGIFSCGRESKMEIPDYNRYSLGYADLIPAKIHTFSVPARQTGGEE